MCLRRRLQWSHDLSAMDTILQVANFDLSDQRTLQWSHDLSAMDTRPAG